MRARWWWLDVRATLGERKTLWAAGLMLYMVLAMPVLVARPPEHVLSALQGWFATADPFILFLFIWTDLAMNKIIVTLGVMLAGGVFVRERETGQLAVLLSKPVSPGAYYRVRVLSACAVMAVLYVGAHLAVAPLVARDMPGFRWGLFFLSMGVHLFAAFFAICFSALLAVLIQRRALAVLVSMLLLFALVGFTFIGFYNPAWSGLASFNPITQGSSVLGHLEDLAPRHVLVPILLLTGLNAVLIALGALRVRHLET